MVALPIDTDEAPAARRNLMDVLAFLERRGASPDVLRLAMVRAGIAPEVSQLMSQCITSGQLTPLGNIATPAAACPAEAPKVDQLGTASAGALRWLAGTFLVWGGLLAGGLVLGFAIGLDIGMAQGFEEGIDRLGILLQAAR